MSEITIRRNKTKQWFRQQILNRKRLQNIIFFARKCYTISFGRLPYANA